MSTADYALMNRLAPLAQDGDKLAEERLLKVAREWAAMVVYGQGWHLPSGGDQQDLIQVAVIGVAEALRTWDPGKHAVFTKWAERVMLCDIIQEVKNANRQMRQGQNNATSLDEPVYANERRKPDDTYLARMDFPDGSGLGRDPADAVSGEADDLLAAMIAPLSDLERLIFTRVILGEEPYRNVSDDYGYRWKTIDNACQRARRKCTKVAQQLAVDGPVSDDLRAAVRRAVENYLAGVRAPGGKSRSRNRRETATA
ncbi:MAG TPA: sigma-70 family RNA polymerase sigma factor [Symbiobacteriaceae bacterium]|nr:sigma-70 family RNA polymerase sigma factor [Symbiobacteriaceae bacterium]